jgi:hypothetical protein
VATVSACVALAMPRLAVTGRGVPCRSLVARTAATMRSATITAWAASVSGSTTRNSSPP